MKRYDAENISERSRYTYEQLNVQSNMQAAQTLHEIKEATPSLRDTIAMHALAGNLANQALVTWSWKTHAEEAYAVADAMLEARK